MIPAAFSYTRATSVDDALRILGEGAGETKVIAGGQSLLPLLKLRLARAERLLDIGRLRELRGVAEAGGGGLSIGALTTYRDLLDSPLVTARLPMLAEAVDQIADVQVRNRGTVGGSLAHADPASDLPAVMLALDATFVLRSANGERTVAAADFFQGPFATDAGADELLTEIRLPALPSGAGAAYRKLAQPASGYSIVACAAVVARSGDRVGHVRCALTGVGDAAYRATAVEAALGGSDGSPRALAAAASHAAEGRTVNEDIHADRAYRTAMAVVYARRALEAALDRAR